MCGGVIQPPADARVVGLVHPPPPPGGGGGFLGLKKSPDLHPAGRHLLDYVVDVFLIGLREVRCETLGRGIALIWTIYTLTL